MASEVERFHPTSGRPTGILGLVVVAVVLITVVVDQGTGIPPWLVSGCALAATVIWVVLLRPAAWVAGTDLVLRNMLDVRTVPLAAIERVAVGQMLVVVVEGRRYSNAGIGRSRRQSLRDARLGADALPGESSYGAFVETRLAGLSEDARARGEHAGAVRRQWAWPEITALAVTGLALVVAVLVG